VPDLSGFAPANDLVGRSDVEVREAIGDKFPKHIYHSNRLHRSAHRALGARSLGGGRHRRADRAKVITVLPRRRPWQRGSREASKFAPTRYRAEKGEALTPPCPSSMDQVTETPRVLREIMDRQSARLMIRFRARHRAPNACCDWSAPFAVVRTRQLDRTTAESPHG
jgi:hypothetical protein